VSLARIDPQTAGEYHNGACAAPVAPGIYLLNLPGNLGAVETAPPHLHQSTRCDGSAALLVIGIG
jgi:hypothetical protein